MSSSSRRDTAAARAALARRRQRGIFTPSSSNNIGGSHTATAQLQSNGNRNGNARPKSETPPLRTPNTVTSSQSSDSTASKTKTTTTEPKAVIVSDPLPRPRPPPPVAAAATSRRESSLTRHNTNQHWENPAKEQTASRQPKSNGQFSSAAVVTNSNEVDRAVRFTSLSSSNGGGRRVAVGNQQDANDNVTVVEEAEPVVETDILDAKCLTYGSSIVIRSQSTASAYISVRKKTRGDAARYLAVMDGRQVFSLTRCCQDGTTTDAVASDDNVDDNFVRYGDVVILRSSMALDRTLGIRTHSTVTEGATSFEVGFFRSVPTSADEWTVLRGGHVVLVGSAATAAATTSTTSTNGKQTAAVRSGDAILLRNKSTGGLLAIDSMEHDTLHLLTDSYDSNVTRTGDSSDRDPLSKIQHHDRILPSSMETFQFVNAEVPPCPQWVDDGNRRLYDSDSYLLDSSRNCRQDRATLTLFGKTLRDGRKSLKAALKEDITIQERLLLDEVIGSLIGLEGNYIQYDGTAKEPCYQISEPAGVSFDISLRNLVNRILPLSTSFVHVRSFLSVHRPGYEYGFVVQAVCEAFDELLYQHLVFAADMERQLRHGSSEEAMTMNILNVNIQIPLRRMVVLEYVIAVIRERKGGALLNALQELKSRVFAGDAITQQVLEVMLQKGSVPYFKMLDTWLDTGEIHDPFDEFMIETTGYSQTDVGYDGDTWNELFRIRNEHVLLPVLSSPAVQEQILLTGKYWNAVQLCNRTATDESNTESPREASSGAHVHYGMDAVELSKFVHSTYRVASRKLLNILMGDFDAMETLVTLKRFFLLHQGDFLVHMFDAAGDELSQELNDISRGRMQQLLSMCVQLTEPEHDDWISALSSTGEANPVGPLTAQSLRCSFAPDSLIDHLDALHAENGGIGADEPKTPSRNPYGVASKGMTGIEAFSLHFDRIPFPSSLIISQRALSSYQLLFRHLFFAKHVERRLVRVWLDHQMMKQFQSLRSAMGPTYCLRQRMLHFMQNFIYYMMFEVIEPNWLEMENAIRKQQSTTNGASRGTQTVDDVIRVHNEFLSLAMTECLLTKRELVRTLTKLMGTCLLFSEQLKRFMEATKIAEENKAVAKEKRSTVQRNLNDPTNMKRAPSKKAIRKAMVTQNEERSLRMQKQTARVERELANESYKRMISRFDEVFTENLTAFMKHLLSASTEEHHSQMAHLCIRLDYNGFVTRQMGLH